MQVRRHFAVLFFLFSGALSALTIGEALNENPPRLSRLRLAIKCDPNPGYINEKGESYLHIAVKRNLYLSVKLLMKLPQVSALYHHRNDLGQTAIDVAIIKSKQRVFDELVKSLHLFNDESEHDWSLLHIAAAYNRAKMIKPLVNAGVPVNREDSQGWSALDLARYWDAKQAEKALVDSEAISTREGGPELLTSTESSENDDEANAQANNADEGLEIDDCKEASAVCSGKNAYLSMCVVGAACCALPAIYQFISSL